MANITTETIEGLTPNNNLKLIAEVVEVDNRVRINSFNPSPSSTLQRGVRIEAPGGTGSYTLIMPDNAIADGAFLRVKSIVGDRVQLEFADGSDTKKILDATQLTSGSLPADRYPTSGIPGTALELVERKNVTQNSEITYEQIFDNLEDDTVYRMVGDLSFILDETGGEVNTYPIIEWLDENGDAENNIAFSRWYGNNSTDPVNSKVRNKIDCSVGHNSTFYTFNCDFYTSAGLNWFMWWGTTPRKNNARKAEIYATFDSASSNFDTKRIHGIKFTSFHGDHFNIGTDIKLYKYREA